MYYYYSLQMYRRGPQLDVQPTTNVLFTTLDVPADSRSDATASSSEVISDSLEIAITYLF